MIPFLFKKKKKKKKTCSNRTLARLSHAPQINTTLHRSLPALVGTMTCRAAVFEHCQGCRQQRGKPESPSLWLSKSHSRILNPQTMAVSFDYKYRLSLTRSIYVILNSWWSWGRLRAHSAIVGIFPSRFTEKHVGALTNGNFSRRALLNLQPRCKSVWAGTTYPIW